MLTVRTSEADLAKTLNMGADDLMGKPFSLVALSSRVKALLRHPRAVRAAGADLVGLVELNLGEPGSRRADSAREVE